MTSRILGLTPDLETHLHTYYEFIDKHNPVGKNEREQTKNRNDEFQKQHPFFIDIYLLDDNHIVNKQGNPVGSEIEIVPGNKSVGLYASPPGSDDFHGKKWDIRGNSVLAGERMLGEVAYAHESAKPISQLLRNNERQHKVIWQTLQNINTYLHQKILGYDARDMDIQDIDQRAAAIRGFMQPVHNAYQKRHMEIGRKSEAFWNQLE